MSDSPCTGCRATNHGRLFYAYVHHYMGDERENRRVRLCQDCVFERLAPLLDGADYEENGRWTPNEATRMELPSVNVPPRRTGTVPLVANLSSVAPSTSTRTKRDRSATKSSAGDVGR